jgi:hypothetical protein
LIRPVCDVRSCGIAAARGDAAAPGVSPIANPNQQSLGWGPKTLFDADYKRPPVRPSIRRGGRPRRARTRPAIPRLPWQCGDSRDAVTLPIQ